MKFATMACTALVGLFVSLAPALLGARAEAQVPNQPQGKVQQPPQPNSAKAAPVPAAQQTAATPPPPSAGRQGPQTKAGDRRRRTYASCNRASHTRGLRGGARRRFLIRCKLGYERPKPGQNQQAPQGRQP